MIAINAMTKRKLTIAMTVHDMVGRRSVGGSPAGILSDSSNTGTLCAQQAVLSGPIFRSSSPTGTPSPTTPPGAIVLALFPG